jgi:hypothetical protein
MKTYRVHFSCYDENNGEVDESVYSVAAESLAAARREARLLRDRNDDKRGIQRKRAAPSAKPDYEAEGDCCCDEDDWEDEI